MPVKTARVDVDFRINQIHSWRYVSVIARQQIFVVERRRSRNVLVLVPRRQSQGNDARYIAQDILRCHSNVAIYHRIQSSGQLEQHLTRRWSWQRWYQRRRWITVCATTHVTCVNPCKRKNWLVKMLCEIFAIKARRVIPIFVPTFVIGITFFGVTIYDWGPNGPLTSVRRILRRRRRVTRIWTGRQRRRVARVTGTGRRFVTSFRMISRRRRDRRLVPCDAAYELGDLTVRQVRSYPEKLHRIVRKKYIGWVAIHRDTNKFISLYQCNLNLLLKSDFL